MIETIILGLLASLLAAWAWEGRHGLRSHVARLPCLAGKHSWDMGGAHQLFVGEPFDPFLPTVCRRCEARRF